MSFLQSKIGNKLEQKIDRNLENKLQNLESRLGSQLNLFHEKLNSIDSSLNLKDQHQNNRIPQNQTDFTKPISQLSTPRANYNYRNIYIIHPKCNSSKV